MYLLDALVTRRREVARQMHVVSLRAPEIAASALPGQFVNLSVPERLLRRPFSVYRADGDLIEVLLKPVGAGTEWLASVEPGTRISTLGPLGSGFDIAAGDGPAVLVSGGLGVAAMPLAAQAAGRLSREVVWVHGARTAAELCGEWEGDRVVWATDDGSQGVRGTVVDALPAGPALVLACGPNQMLQAIAGRFPAAQVAIETHMGCGTGVCLGCAVPLRAGGYDRACREGPVYDAGAIDWGALPAHLQYAVA
jgi:dihydroorotate dehydrogenase electron transfer subunit